MNSSHTKPCSGSENPHNHHHNHHHNNHYHPIHLILHRPFSIFVVFILSTRCQTESSSDPLYFRPEVESNHLLPPPSPDCPVQPPCYCAQRQDAATTATTTATSHVIRIVCDTFSRQRRFPRFASTIGSVRQIWLTYSGLLSLPNLAFQALKVIELDLQGNNFGERIGSRAFAKVNRHLHALNLAWSNITRLPAKLFRGMVQLRNLSLAENRLNRLPSTIFQDLRNLDRLSLSGNDLIGIPSDIFRYQTNLQLLDLGYCRLGRPPRNVFAGLWSLGSLDLRGNNISQLFDGTFSSLHLLHSLFLGHNQLSRLHGHAFRGLDNLRVLNLAESYLEMIDDGVFTDTKHLETIDLGDNRLSVLPPGTLSRLPKLQHLSIDGNQFEHIPSELVRLPLLRYLDVSYNRIQSIEECVLDSTVHPRLEYVNLRENPFHCNCSMFRMREVKMRLFTKWLDKSKGPPFVPGRCSTPPSLHGVPITNWIDLDCYDALQSRECNVTDTSS